MRKCQALRNQTSSSSLSDSLAKDNVNKEKVCGQHSLKAETISLM
jgi:hypothetical protein